MKLVRTALLSFLISFITFFPVRATTAGAAPQAVADSSVSQPGGLSISTGTFILYATATPLGPNPVGAPLTLTKTAAAQYFYVRNTGSIDVARFSIAITYDSGPGPVTLDRCDAGVAFSATNTCSSGIKTAMSISTGVMSLSLSPNTWYAFELDPKKNVLPSISVSVSSSQIRNAITTNS